MDNEATQQTIKGHVKTKSFDSEDALLGSFDVSADSKSVLKVAIDNSKGIFRSAKSLAVSTDQVNPIFFIHQRDKGGNFSMGIFDPSICMVGMPDCISADEHSSFAITGLKAALGEVSAHAVTHVHEVWMLDKKMNEAELEFVQEHGVKEHPEAVERVIMFLFFNYRGQTCSIEKHIDIVNRESGRVLVNESDWQVYLGQMKGRIIFEANLFTPLF